LINDIASRSGSSSPPWASSSSLVIFWSAISVLLFL
jgi:hypothetical protein